MILPFMRKGRSIRAYRVSTVLSVRVASMKSLWGSSNDACTERATLSEGRQSNGLRAASRQ
jgi:hypothetical protein